MAKKAKNTTNIQIYRRRKTLNIGVLLFGVIFVYLLITCLMYVTSKHISVYEVREGSILKDTAYTGIIVRDEQIVKSDAEGFINYFVTEGSKVGKKTNVYCLTKNKLDLSSTSQSQPAEPEVKDSSEDVAEPANVNETENTQVATASSDNNELSAEEQAAIVQKSDQFSDSYRPESYGDIYTYKNSVNDILKNRSAEVKQARLDTLLQGGIDGAGVYPATSDGIIVYTIDGFEDLAVSKVTADMINKKDYKTTALTDNTEINVGDPVYKLIKSETWTVAVELDDEMAEQLGEKKYVKVRFPKDNEKIWAKFAIRNTKDTHLGFFTFDTSMVRYASDRFIDIELVLADEKGLKIPRSSVVEKEFYTVPASFITRGGNSNQSGVLVQGNKETAEFEATDFYYHDLDSDMYFIDKSSFKKGTVLVMPDTGETYTLDAVETLTGVYNINKGYAVFKYIDIICESEEYYIIKNGSDFGLSNYDHIALDSSTVREEALIF